MHALGLWNGLTRAGCGARERRLRAYPDTRERMSMQMTWLTAKHSPISFARSNEDTKPCLTSGGLGSPSTRRRRRAAKPHGCYSMR